MTAEAIKAALIVDAIIADLMDRRGLGHEWRYIDSVTREEIRDTWCDIAINRLKPGEECGFSL